MGILAKLRERVGIIKFLVNAQKTIWYPILFAILCIISGLNDYTVYLPIMWTLVGFVLFSVLFTDDNKVFLVPLCMIFFALGSDAPATAFGDSGGDMLSFMNPDALDQIIAMGVIAVGALILRLILDGSLAAAIKCHRLFTASIIAMDAAFLLNGILRPDYNTDDLAFGALVAAVLTAVYFLVCGMLENSSQPIFYGCVAMLCTAYIALTQVLAVIYKLHLAGGYLVYDKYGVLRLNRSGITLGWGISTVIAAVFVLGIPAALYLARNHKASLISFFSCPLFVLGTVLVNARASMLVSVAIFAVCAILCMINGKNKVLIRIYFAVCVCAAAGIVVYLINKYPELIKTLRELLRISVNMDSGRNELWEDGWADFMRYPFTGAGFSDGGLAEDIACKNIYSNMYHNIFVEWYGAMGIVGCIAFALHLVELVICSLKQFSINKLLLLALPLTIIALSIFDNFFFYPHFQIFYAIFLALAEKYCNKTKIILKGAA
ncbi:MAG: O-antigen ligase family protein [Clostridia bacterium]|nr:O-antigen ligase family protein [Clostridia bacterium]